MNFMDSLSQNSEIKLPTGKNLVLSSSPHLSTGANLRKIMGGVLIALIPAIIASGYFFGFQAIFIIVYTALCGCGGCLVCICRKAGVEKRR